MVKKIIIIVVVLVVLIGAFVAFSFFSKQPEPVTPLTSTPSADALGSDDNREFLNSVLALQGIKLDDNLFRDPQFVRLQDFSTQLPDIARGRTNPFAPF